MEEAPKDGDAFFNLGIMLAEMEQYEESVREIDVRLTDFLIVCLPGENASKGHRIEAGRCRGSRRIGISTRRLGQGGRGRRMLQKGQGNYEKNEEKATIKF